MSSVTKGRANPRGSYCNETRYCDAVSRIRVSTLGRNTTGVRGIKMREGPCDCIDDCSQSRRSQKAVDHFGKRVRKKNIFSEYRLQKRGVCNFLTSKQTIEMVFLLEVCSSMTKIKLCCSRTKDS